MSRAVRYFYSTCVLCVVALTAFGAPAAHSQTAYFSNGGTVQAFSVPANELVKSIACSLANVGVQPIAIASSPDGTKVWVCEYSNYAGSLGKTAWGELVCIDTASNDANFVAAPEDGLGDYYYSVAASPDGTIVLVGDADGGIVSVGTTSVNLPVTLNGPVTAATEVILTSSSAAATVLGSVTVQKGARTATFTVATTAVTAKAVAKITATAPGGSASASLTIKP